MVIKLKKKIKFKVQYNMAVLTSENCLVPISDPIFILNIVKKINPECIKHTSDRNYQLIEFTKKDFIQYIYERYRGISFSKKIIAYFFPSH